MKSIKTKSTAELVQIIETPENYQDFLYEAACVELPLREISDEFLYQFAEDIYRKKVQEKLQKSFLNTNKLDLPESSILSEAQRMDLFKDEFEFNQSRRGDLFKDLDKYMFGG